MILMNPQRTPRPFGFGITADNVNEALPYGLSLLQQVGVASTSRGIETIKVPGPVMTVYRTPQRRVLFDEVRDANPFFHLMESLWILGGSNKLALPAYYLKRYADFSDDGVTLHGAYGHRLRKWHDGYDENTGREWQVDQIDEVIRLLRDKPDTRQAVMSIWDPREDLGTVTKDMPCNDMVMFGVTEGFLDMQVCNRSNDAIWGAYGANAVQFSMLHEIIAIASGLEVGYYVQQSWNYHVYPTNPFWGKFLANEHEHGEQVNPYMNPDMQVYPLANTPAEALDFLKDCVALCYLFEQSETTSWKTPFFIDVVQPLMDAYEYYKVKEYDKAIAHAMLIAAPDWRLACCQWLLRRQHKAQA
jgi:thymidylate synthase